MQNTFLFLILLGNLDMSRNKIKWWEIEMYHENIYFENLCQFSLKVLGMRFAQAKGILPLCKGACHFKQVQFPTNFGGLCRACNASSPFKKITFLKILADTLINSLQNLCTR